MKIKKTLFAALCFLISGQLAAQQAYTVTAQQPALVNGLQMGFTIKSQEVKKVGDKGDFSRYSIRFYVTNTLGESKIILYKQGLNLLNNVSDQLAQFNCINATGARLTSKEATIRATACNVLALTDDKDCATNKTTQNKRFVQIGYWIKAGQTISADAIVIVPLNDAPNIQVTYLADMLQPAASASIGSNQDVGRYQPPPAYTDINTQGLLKIRNVYTNTYINYETGVMRSSEINSGWWSAHWQLVPVPGTNRVNIKNQWKGTYMSIDGGTLDLFVNYVSDGAMWILEPAGNGAFHIKNVASGQYLCIASNQLKTAINYRNVQTSEWTFEP